MTTGTTERGNIGVGKNVPPCCRDYRRTGKHLKTCPQHRSWKQFLRDLRKSKAGQTKANADTLAEMEYMATGGGISVRVNPDSWNPDAKHDRAQDAIYGDMEQWLMTVETRDVTVTFERKYTDCGRHRNGLAAVADCCDRCSGVLFASRPRRVYRITHDDGTPITCDLWVGHDD